MFNGSDVIYRYDGSFYGLMCCVFQSYRQKISPVDIVDCNFDETFLMPEIEIITDEDKAKRVIDSIPKKMGEEALDFIQRAFLTCLAHKELFILHFMKMGYNVGPKVMNMLDNDVVNTLFKAVKHLNNESHLLKEFIRFSDYNGILVSQIEPKNSVLPLIARHFCERYPEERFLIYDKTHHLAIIYENHRSTVVSMEHFTMPNPDRSEWNYRRLWKLFYQTIEVEGRSNPRCRMSHMPKRYWNCMTEFEDDEEESAFTQSTSHSDRLGSAGHHNCDIAEHLETYALSAQS